MVAVILSACLMQEASGVFLHRADPKDGGSCAPCLPAANELLGSDCKEFRCLVKAFAAQKKVLTASEIGRKKVEAVRNSVTRCAKENRCDLQPAISAAKELGIDLYDLKSSFLQLDAVPKDATIGLRAGATKVVDAAVVHKDDSHGDVREHVVDAYVKEALATKKAEAKHNQMMMNNPIYRAAHTKYGDVHIQVAHGMGN